MPAPCSRQRRPFCIIGALPNPRRLLLPQFAGFVVLDFLPALRNVSSDCRGFAVTSESMQDVADKSVIAGPGWRELLGLHREGNRALKISLPNVACGKLNVCGSKFTVQFQYVIQGCPGSTGRQQHRPVIRGEIKLPIRLQCPFNFALLRS